MTKRTVQLTKSVAVMLLLLATAACESTPRDLIVLLPEADGKVGQVTVTTAGGSTTLSSASAATRLNSSNQAPGQVFQIKDENVDSICKSAIAAQPKPPTTFTLYFRTDRTRMTRPSNALWPNILAEIESRTAPDISIIGHTDRTGPESYNEPLSRRRARVIHKRLVKAGVDPDIIDYSWHGEKNPIIQTPDGAPERRNRRVEVIVR